MTNKTQLRGRIPRHLTIALDEWEEKGLLHGNDFLARVLSNDLFGSFREASIAEVMALPDLVVYIANYLNGECWGSLDKIRKWKELRSTPDSGTISGPTSH